MFRSPSGVWRTGSFGLAGEVLAAEAAQQDGMTLRNLGVKLSKTNDWFGKMTESISEHRQNLGFVCLGHLKDDKDVHKNLVVGGPGVENDDEPAGSWRSGGPWQFGWALQHLLPGMCSWLGGNFIVHNQQHESMPWERDPPQPLRFSFQSWDDVFFFENEMSGSCMDNCYTRSIPPHNHEPEVFGWLSGEA